MARFKAVESPVYFNGSVFNPIINTDESIFRYDILEIRFEISIKPYWFFQNRRRNRDVAMDLYFADIKHVIPVQEILSIPLFAKITAEISDEDEKVLKVADYVAKNDNVKDALIDRYESILLSELYKSDSNIRAVPKTERFGCYEDVLNYKNNYVLGRPEDDYSGITDIRNSIISVY